MAEEEKKEQPIIVKKIVQGGGHHGGAWKVAYADFVTAMMAFFLLLWLLNVTTDEQKNAISNYFDPTHPRVSEELSGAGGVLGGLSMATQGAMATNVQPLTTPPPTGSNSNELTRQNKDRKKPGTPQEAAVEKAKDLLREQEERRFEEAQQKIQQAIQEDPELAALSKNLMVDMTPEGLRIQIVDQEGESMFARGSAQMYDKTRKLMQKVSQIVLGLENEVSIRGHTDSVPYGPGADYTNWELSTDRANASRRVLLDAGMPAERLNNVVGKADTEHLVPDKPEDARNRRISIVLLKEELTNPEFEKKAEQVVEENPGLIPAENQGTAPAQEAPQQVPVGTFRKTPGKVEFP